MIENIKNTPFNSCITPNKSNFKLSNSSKLNDLESDQVCFSGNKVKKEDKRPIAAICDWFTKTFDIDGDGIPDVPHGFLVWSNAHKTDPTSKIINAKIGGTDRDGDTDKKIAETVKKIAARIENGEKIKAVNLSLGIDISFKSLARATELPLNHENINLYKDALRDIIMDKEKCEKALIPFMLKRIDAATLIDIFTSIEKITSMGVPVFNTAGNDGTGDLNIFNVAKGVISVGALDSNGEIADYSGANSITSQYETGTFSVKPIKKDDFIVGYNITDSDKIDVPVTKTSSGRFVGKSLNEVLATDKDCSKFEDLISANNALDERIIGSIEEYGLNEKDVERINNVIFPIDKIESIYCIPPSARTKVLKSFGDYVDAEMNFVYKVDKDNKIKLTHIYRDLENIEGTSFASPIAMMKYVKDKK